jgi:hypothetical protein
MYSAPPPRSARADRFKIEVTNNAECYTYLFGQETDGGTYVLFPYTPKHSPYCGITGTRVFPSDQSLTADEVGTTDVMAIVVANQPLDYPKLNEALKASSAKGMDAKGGRQQDRPGHRAGDRQAVSGVRPVPQPAIPAPPSPG